MASIANTSFSTKYLYFSEDLLTVSGCHCFQHDLLQLLLRQTNRHDVGFINMIWIINRSLRVINELLYAGNKCKRTGVVTTGRPSSTWKRSSNADSGAFSGADQGSELGCESAESSCTERIWKSNLLHKTTCISPCMLESMWKEILQMSGKLVEIRKSWTHTTRKFFIAS